MDEVKSEDVTFRFHQLLANFSELTNKNLNPIKTDSDNLKDVETNKNDVLQPLERYLCVSPSKRLKHLFQCIRLCDVVIGKVSSVVGNLLNISLLCVISHPKHWIEDLKITATAELTDRARDHDELEVDDQVKGVITHVDYASQNLLISFNERYLTGDKIKYFPLGRIDDDTEYLNILSNKIGKQEYDDSKRYLKHLQKDCTFLNPHCIQNLVKALNIDQCHASNFQRNQDEKIFDESVKSLREKQSSKWSMEMVGIGISYFRNNNEKEAMKYLDQAISFYSKNVEAFVARGALKANRNNLKDAIADLRNALQLNPKHRNGRKYLLETLLTKARSLEKQFKWKEASLTYKEMLELDSEHEEAKTRYQQIKQMVSHKVVSGSSLGAGKNKIGTLDPSKEQISKLRKLLENETTRNTSSCSSSSSNSDTDDVSDGDWIEKSVKKKTCSSEHNECFRYEKDFNKTFLESNRHDRERKISYEGRNIPKKDKDPDPRKDTLLKKLPHFSRGEMDLVTKLLRTNSKSKHENSSYQKTSTSTLKSDMFQEVNKNTEALETRRKKRKCDEKSDKLARRHSYGNSSSSKRKRSRRDSDI